MNTAGASGSGSLPRWYLIAISQELTADNMSVVSGSSSTSLATRVIRSGLTTLQSQT